jgi:hypothetical protein
MYWYEPFRRYFDASERQRARRDEYRRAARLAQLTDVRSSFGPDEGGVELVGAKGGFRIRLAAGHTESPTVVTVAGALPMDVHIECTVVGNAYRNLGQSGGGGDARSDAQMQRLLAAALCGLILTEDGEVGPLTSIAVQRGELAVELPDLQTQLAPATMLAPQHPLAALLDGLVALAGQLRVPGAVPRALRALLHHADLHVQVESAVALGAETHGLLRGLLARPELGDADSLRLARVLERELNVDEALELLRRSQERRRRGTAAVALEALSRQRDIRVVPAVIGVVEGHDSVLAPAAARSLRRCAQAVPGQQPAIESALLRALETGDHRLKTAVAEALEHAGSIDAVPRLRALIGKRFDEAFDRAAANAIAMIQVRAAGAAPGQLTLATERSAGQLSLPDGAAGQLSVPTDHESS